MYIDKSDFGGREYLLFFRTTKPLHFVCLYAHDCSSSRSQQLPLVWVLFSHKTRQRSSNAIYDDAVGPRSSIDARYTYTSVCVCVCFNHKCVMLTCTSIFITLIVLAAASWQSNGSRFAGVLYLLVDPQQNILRFAVLFYKSFILFIGKCSLKIRVQIPLVTKKRKEINIEKSRSK